MVQLLSFLANTRLYVYGVNAKYIMFQLNLLLWIVLPRYVDEETLWSSGYGRRLLVDGSRVWILAMDDLLRLTIFTAA